MCPSGRSLVVDATSSPELKSAFDVLDADRDGKISRDDLRRFYAAGFSHAGEAGEEEEEEMIGTMISAADSNQDGFVEYEEFERVLRGNNYKTHSTSSSSAATSSGVMVEVFKAMDKDGDGKLSHGDLKSYMHCAGFEATDDDIRAMIRLGASSAENDAVSFDDLLRILAVN